MSSYCWGKHGKEVELLVLYKNPFSAPFLFASLKIPTLTGRKGILNTNFWSFLSYFILLPVAVNFDLVVVIVYVL
ncbi:hypothetical protein VNO80_10550 [Phaseolus coccineus]|uniref:Uncharacterized protein n=1 Tax=Phaseolus coccineus TaxID=3886 RepID=A0AAN9REQ7_PHACN